MVDFHKNETFSYTAMQIINLMILEKLQALIDGIEAYNRLSMKQGHADNYEVRARLNSLYNTLYGMLQRDVKINMNRLKELVYSEDYEKNLEAFYILARWLDDKRITRADTKSSYDSSILEEENNVKGL